MHPNPVDEWLWAKEEDKKDPDRDTENRPPAQLEKHNLFDFDDISDLPPELRATLSTISIEEQQEDKVFTLFSLAPRPVSLKEIQVAWFREYQDILSIQTIRKYTNKLLQKKILEVHKKGVYKLAPSD